MSQETRNVIIIGSGPSGYTAGLYTARANLHPLLFAGLQHGGQLTTTTDIENYPGFPEGIAGPQLMEDMRKQAVRFGTEIIYDIVTKVDFSSQPLRIWAGDAEYRSKTVIISTGASPNFIGLDSEQKLIGRGVSTCATCDGYFFRDQDIAIVGGGDSAMEEAIFLTKFANKVTVIHRRNHLRASKIMQEKAFNNDKIEFVWDSVVKEVHDVAQGKVTGVTVGNIVTNETMDIVLTGLFIAIGHQPNTAIFTDQIIMDKNGYIKPEARTMTNIPGVFAAGDVADHIYRQAITAAGMGCQAAIDAERYLESL